MNELYNTDLERGLIAQTLSEYGAQVRILRNIVSPEDFRDLTCAAAWRAVCAVDDSGAQVNIGNVYAQICECEGKETANAVVAMDTGGTGGDLPRWAISVAALAAKRRLLDGMRSIADALKDPEVTVEECTDMLARLSTSETAAHSPTATWSELSTDLLRRAQDIAQGKESDITLTGFNYLDMRGGLKAGNLDIIAGRTSNGKTALAMAIAVNTAMAGNATAIYSMEMTLDELATRIASMVSHVPCRQIDRGPLDDEEFSTLFRSVSDTASAPILFDRRRTADLDKVTASIRRMAVCEGVRVVVLDYIQQLTSTRHRDKRSLVSEACVTLKTLAVELGITIIALSQLARENPGGNHVPLMSQLKEAGVIENSADNVYMIYRAELYGEAFPDAWASYDTTGTALVMHSKARSGSIGGFLVGFNAECVHYYDSDNFAVSENVTHGVGKTRKEKENLVESFKQKK